MTTATFTRNHPLEELSPLDGRYLGDVQALLPYFSESALYRARVQVEVEYLIFLARMPGVTFVPDFTVEQREDLRELYLNFSLERAEAIATWDRRVNHDVKSVEYWLQERMTELGMAAWHNAIHWGLTSEDVNNLAYALLIDQAVKNVMLPTIDALYDTLRRLAVKLADVRLLARTHGQPASPTTLGKELNIFAGRLRRMRNEVARVKPCGKVGGATGTLAAHVTALPKVNWNSALRTFVRSLGIKVVYPTSQIEPHDWIAQLCNAIKQVNVVILDLNQDLWSYIKDEVFVQTVNSQEVGSSTMPNKVNPIDFENSEGNLHVAGALLELYSRKLPISRLQRDLSDSTVLRNLGGAFGYSLIGYRRALKGLGKLVVNEEHCEEEVRLHAEVLAEAIQTILRRIDYPEPYEALKKLTRGSRTMTLAQIHAFIDTLDVSAETVNELKALRPEHYIGLASQMAKQVPSL